MRVLHLTTDLPSSPGISGGSLRQFRLLSGLVALGHTVEVVAPVFDFQRNELDLASMYADAGMLLRDAPRPRSPVRQLLSALRREPGIAFRLFDLPYYGVQARALWRLMADEVEQALDELHPDVVTIDHDINAVWAVPLQARTTAPLVLTLHNVSSDYYRSRARASSSVRSLPYLVEEARMARYFGAHLSRFAHLAVVSEQDAALVRPLYAGPISVVPNGTDALERPLPDAGGATILFTGTMNHPPNREGLLWFVEAVWPELRARQPAARLVVVGRNPQREILELNSSNRGIEVVGEVDSMLPFYERATLVVAPILSGGGTRMKILDALAVGRAVVATSVGAGGLNLNDGRELFIRDDPPAFAEAVEVLVTDVGARRALAAAGHKRVVDLYDWRLIAVDWGEILAATVASRRRPTVRKERRDAHQRTR